MPLKRPKTLPKDLQKPSKDLSYSPSLPLRDPQKDIFKLTNKANQKKHRPRRRLQHPEVPFLWSPTFRFNGLIAPLRPWGPYNSLIYPWRALEALMEPLWSLMEPEGHYEAVAFLLALPSSSGFPGFPSVGPWTDFIPKWLEGVRRLLRGL